MSALNWLSWDGPAFARGLAKYDDENNGDGAWELVLSDFGNPDNPAESLTNLLNYGVEWKAFAPEGHLVFEESDDDSIMARLTPSDGAPQTVALRVADLLGRDLDAKGPEELAAAAAQVISEVQSAQSSG